VVGWLGRVEWSRNEVDVARSLTLEQIIDAAERLVRADGLDALSMRRLASELHVAHSGLYSYRLDRQSLLVALLERRMSLMMPELEKAAQLEPACRLLRLASLLLEVYRTSQVGRQVAAALLDDGVFTAGAIGSHSVDWLESLIDQTCLELAGEDAAGDLRVLFDAISRAPLVSGPAGARSAPFAAGAERLLLAGLSAGLAHAPSLAA